MLRNSICLSTNVFTRRLPYAENVARQWQTLQIRRNTIKKIRTYTDQKKPNSNHETSQVPQSSSAQPSSSSGQETVQTTISDKQTPSLLKSNSGISSSIPLATSPSSLEKISSFPAITPPHKPRRIFRKLTTFVLFLTVFGFTGGLYYSRLNDNFYDFFTEYIPFGEQAILYLEELEYRKRFPSNSESVAKDNGFLTTIPRQSGVSWRVAEGQKSGSTGRHTDATSPNSSSLQTYSEIKPNLGDPSEKEVGKNLAKSKKDSSKPEPGLASTSTSSEPVLSTAPEVDQPSKFSQRSNQIEPITFNDVSEPIVQDLVKVINNIIAVTEAGNSNAKFSSTIENAKVELSTVGNRILALKEEALKEADAKIQAEKENFDRAAKELIRRVELEMKNQQSSWQEEYQNERERLHESYEKKLESELRRADELHEQRLRNSLLEQAIEMKKQFGQEIKDRVEEERNGRLKKLSELSDTVNELEKLATNWNSVVDFNLKTQQLHVAVEATRAILEKSEEPRPFLRELVALREIASDDPVVNAAIASINPIAYHHGIPSSGRIIDRFRRVATEVRKAALLPTDAGVASHASSFVLSKLLFKKKGLAIGDDVESILTRAETYLEEGDLDAAAREVNGLKGWAKTLSRDWLDEVRRVLEVRQALDVIATEARLKSLTIE